MLDTRLHLFTYVRKKYGDEYLHRAVSLYIYHVLLKITKKITKSITYAVSAEEKN